MVTIKNSSIRFTGLCLLIINIFAFFITWLHWYISVPAIILLTLGLYMYRKNSKPDAEVFSVSKGMLLLIFGIMVAWVLLSGLGGAFPQKPDLNIRNAILHDLINYSWPVRYADNSDSSLTYYFAFWLIPALIGKLMAVLLGTQAGWIAANISYALYCAVILFVIMLLLISRLKATSNKRILLVAGILIIFSGMDVIPTVLRQIGNSNISLGTHLEWWTYLQYSSDSTQLGWVFNQAVPAWLVTSLLLHEKKMNHFAFLGGLLLPYGPIPFIGVFFLMSLQALREILTAARKHSVLKTFQQILSLPNLVAAIVIFPVYFLFYSNNSVTSGSGFGINFSIGTAKSVSGLSLSNFILAYIAFISFEFIIYIILIWRSSYKKPYFIFSFLGLLLIPVFTLGKEQDFCMRASIPLLFILMVYVSDFLLCSTDGVKKGKQLLNSKTIPLLICLVIGSVTPFVEYCTSFDQIIQSESKCTSIFADKYGTLANKNIDRDNFTTKNASETFFYKFIAKDKQ